MIWNYSYGFKETIEKLIEERDLARKEKRFDDADMIKYRIFAYGVEINDRKDGTTWYFK